jgi:hypothetical protein
MGTDLGSQKGKLCLKIFVFLLPKQLVGLRLVGSKTVQGAHGPQEYKGYYPKEDLSVQVEIPMDDIRVKQKIAKEGKKNEAEGGQKKIFPSFSLIQVNRDKIVGIAVKNDQGCNGKSYMYLVKQAAPRFPMFPVSIWPQ